MIGPLWGAVLFWDRDKQLVELKSVRESTVHGPDCRDCLWGLAHQAAVMAAGGDASLEARAEAAARQAFEPAVSAGLTSPEVANVMYRAIRRVSGVDDPFRDEKLEEMDLARRVFERVRPLFGDDLHSRVTLAALGNTLDFFVGPARAMELIHRQIDGGFTFWHDDRDRLADFLKGRPGLILYMTDNAGEVYFDRPLYETLAQSAHRVVLVVKGGPALNDLTRAELESAGLTDFFGEIADTGADGAGVDWGSLGGEFKRLAAEADLIVAKGMANLETAVDRPWSAPRFHLFKIKCRPIRDFLDASPDSFWALWQEASPPI
jgi:uncharacterized protein with ATP-grasp and redox domains